MPIRGPLGGVDTPHGRGCTAPAPSAVKRSLFLESERLLKQPSALISANCFKGHFVSAFCPLIPAAMAFGQKSPAVTCSGRPGNDGLPHPSCASLPRQGSHGGEPPPQTLCFPWLILPAPPEGPSDSQAPFYRLSEPSSLFPGPRSLGRDAVAGMLGGPAAPPLLSARQ